MHHEIVSTAKQARQFLDFPQQIYKDYPNYIRPLDKDIEEVFDPKKNKFFRNGEATRWLLKDAQGKVLGRVAAFINQRTAKTFEQPTGGMGFFEAVDDQKVADTLFELCKNWLSEKGMEAMDGPINFGERDKWWGLLVEGDYEPNYCMPYQPPYYQRLFENYGFQLYFKQFTYYRPVAEGGMEPKVVQKAERIFSNPDYSFQHAKKNELNRFAEDFRTIYNKAWVRHDGVGSIKKAQSEALMKQIKPVMDEELMWFGYHKDEPVSFFLILPELNQIFKYMNGRWNLWSKLKFLYHQKTKSCKKIFGVVFGVVPEHQGKGMEAAIALRLSRHLWENGTHYLDFEMNWIGDFNPKMMKVSEAVGGKIRKVHHTYRYLFDRSKPYQRAPIID